MAINGKQYKTKPLKYCSQITYRTITRYNEEAPQIAFAFAIYSALGNGYLNKQLEHANPNMERKRSKNSNEHTLTSRKTLLAVELGNAQRTIAQEPQAKTLPQRESEFRNKEMILLSTVSWFWGKITPPQICYLMQDSEDGTFLVTGCRKYEGDYYNPEYSIAVKLCGKVFIFNVQHKNGELCLDFLNPHQPRAVTMFALVSKILQKSKAYGGVGEILGKCGKIAVSLRYPVARISSLSAHCRRVIRLKYEKQDIKDLPVPKGLKTYLSAIW